MIEEDQHRRDVKDRHTETTMYNCVYPSWKRFLSQNTKGFE